MEMSHCGFAPVPDLSPKSIPAQSTTLSRDSHDNVCDNYEQNAADQPLAPQGITNGNQEESSDTLDTVDEDARVYLAEIIDAGEWQLWLRVWADCAKQKQQIHERNLANGDTRASRATFFNPYPQSDTTFAHFIRLMKAREQGKAEIAILEAQRRKEQEEQYSVIYDSDGSDMIAEEVETMEPDGSEKGPLNDYVGNLADGLLKLATKDRRDQLAEMVDEFVRYIPTIGGWHTDHWMNRKAELLIELANRFPFLEQEITVSYKMEKGVKLVVESERLTIGGFHEDDLLNFDLFKCIHFPGLHRDGISMVSELYIEIQDGFKPFSPSHILGFCHIRLTTFGQDMINEHQNPEECLESLTGLKSWALVVLPSLKAIVVVKAGKRRCVWKSRKRQQLAVASTLSSVEPGSRRLCFEDEDEDEVVAGPSKPAIKRQKVVMEIGDDEEALEPTYTCFPDSVNKTGRLPMNWGG